MRKAINAAVAMSQSDYLIKLDAHCAIAPGFDEVLTSEIEDDWIVVPRRYSLEPKTWEPRRHRRIVDYEYLAHPDSNKGRFHGKPWGDRSSKRINRLLDETLTFQGSCWCMSRKHFEWLDVFYDDAYGSFVCEAQEIGLKTWLGGGKVMLNKKTWYAHLWKGQTYRDKFRELYGKGYTRIGHSEYVNSNKHNREFWMNNRWDRQIHDLAWLFKRFAPVPTWEGKI